MHGLGIEAGVIAQIEGELPLESINCLGKETIIIEVHGTSSLHLLSGARQLPAGEEADEARRVSGEDFPSGLHGVLFESEKAKSRPRVLRSGLRSFNLKPKLVGFCAKSRRSSYKHAIASAY